MMKKLSDTWGKWAKGALTTQEQTRLTGGCGCNPSGPPPPPPSTPKKTSNHSGG